MVKSALFSTLFGLALAGFTFTSFVASPSAFADDAKCTIATKGDSPVAKACAKGGRPEAKKQMKELVRMAKDKGKKFTCDGCHKNLESYDLTADAHADLKKLLDAAGAK